MILDRTTAPYTVDVTATVLEALRRLEYRGYDSAGVATVDASGRLSRRRVVRAPQAVSPPLRGPWESPGATKAVRVLCRSEILPP